MTFNNLGWDGVQYLFCMPQQLGCKIMYFIEYENVSFVQIEPKVPYFDDSNDPDDEDEDQDADTYYYRR